VVGGGTVGAWCAWFLAREGLGHVVLIDEDTVGRGASSRAAGMVRAQGGTEIGVRLGMWCRDFYSAQYERTGIDSGFVQQGYFMPAFTDAEVVTARERVAMQQRLGLDVRWVGPDEVDAMNPALAPGRTMGASYSPTDGYVDPPRNVLAYTAALIGAGVDVRERTRLTGLITDSGQVTGVRTSAGDIATERVVLAGGTRMSDLGASLGARIPVGRVRHQVVVTAADPELAPERLPMFFDLVSGIYWRPEDGGLLWGMSNPAEVPGRSGGFDWAYYESIRTRMAELVPATARVGLAKAWAATIEFTPDHLPVLGPLVTAEGPVAGATIASACGHGMMWGPAVSRIAADLALRGTTDLVDVSDLGVDRFDEQGRSRLAADPIALPFPERTTA
jgi:sarcosine oxidase subunit beta